MVDVSSEVSLRQHVGARQLLWAPRSALAGTNPPRGSMGDSRSRAQHRPVLCPARSPSPQVDSDASPLLSAHPSQLSEHGRAATVSSGECDPRSREVPTPDNALKRGASWDWGGWLYAHISPYLVCKQEAVFRKLQRKAQDTQRTLEKDGKV